VTSSGGAVVATLGFMQQRPTNFKEDSSPHPTELGRPIGQYGYKPPSPGNAGSEAYSSNGCYYWCVDTPKANAKVVRRMQITIDFTFKGKIIDTGTGNEVESKEWEWVQNETI